MAFIVRVSLFSTALSDEIVPRKSEQHLVSLVRELLQLGVQLALERGQHNAPGQIRQNLLSVEARNCTRHVFVKNSE